MAPYVVIIGIFHFFFSRNFDRLSFIINYGTLDSLLIKPLDSQFLVSCYYISYSNIFRVIMGLIVGAIFIQKMHLVVTVSSIIGFLALSFFGLTLLYSLWFIISTLIIWSPRLSNLVDFLYTINGLARYPTEMLYETRNFVLYFLIPFNITVAIPTKAFFHKVLAGDVVLLIALSFILLFASRKFWLFALRHYTSASS